MISFRKFAAPLLFAALCLSSNGIAEDLARYRDFQFGMSLEAAAAQLHMNVSSVKTVHQRPAVIQTLQWDRFRYLEVAREADSVRSMLLDFYNGDLSKIVVTYDPAWTEGMTNDDMIEAISVLYGPAAKPEGSIAVSGSAAYENNEKILARWENDLYSYTLFRSSYGNAFGLLAFSKSLALMTRDSIAEADRLDVLEAPAREVARQARLEEERRAAQEKARLISKPKFQP